MLAHVDPADPDHGPRTAKPGTERMCVVTRQVRPVDELIRFVVAPDGAAVPDLKRKLPGRGLWVTATHGAVADAAKRGLFSRGFKKNVKAAPSLADLVGWTERKDGGEVTKYPGFFDGIELSREDAEHLIMQARLAAGWITEADLAKDVDKEGGEEADATEDQAV